MFSNVIEINTPISWQEVTQKDLEIIFRLISKDFSRDEVKAFMLLKWAGLSLIGNNPDGSSIFERARGELLELSHIKIAEALPELAWMDEMPTYPIRLDKWGKSHAEPAGLDEISFEIYLAVENYYQGYISQQSEHLLDEIIGLLYSPAIPPKKINDTLRVSTLFWITALKQYNIKRYPDLYSATPQDSENLLGAPQQSYMDSVNAQIRALTKGDITKEKEVFSATAARALAELNAQAKEYREFNAKIKR